jgi:hypothetical protein
LAVIKLFLKFISLKMLKILNYKGKEKRKMGGNP